MTAPSTTQSAPGSQSQSTTGPGTPTPDHTGSYGSTPGVAKTSNEGKGTAPIGGPVAPSTIVEDKPPAAPAGTTPATSGAPAHVTPAGVTPANPGVTPAGATPVQPGVAPTMTAPMTR